MTMTHKEAIDAASRYAAMIPVPDAEDLTEFLRAYIEARGLVLVPKERIKKMLDYADADYVPNGLFAEFGGYIVSDPFKDDAP